MNSKRQFVWHTKLQRTSKFQKSNLTAERTALPIILLNTYFIDSSWVHFKALIKADQSKDPIHRPLQNPLLRYTFAWQPRSDCHIDHQKPSESVTIQMYQDQKVQQRPWYKEQQKSQYHQGHQKLQNEI